MNLSKITACIECLDAPRSEAWGIVCSEACAKAALKKASGWLYGMARQRHVLAIRERIFNAHNWICHLCGKEIAKGQVYSAATTDTYPSLDHLKPKSLGGDDEEENLRPAHMGCNARRGNREIVGAA